MSSTGDPFPNRPQHDDFPKLASIVSMLDLEAESGDLDTIIKEVIDSATLVYVADQRVLRLMRMGLYLSNTSKNRSLLGALWLDAFLAGHRFAKDTH